MSTGPDPSPNPAQAARAGRARRQPPTFRRLEVSRTVEVSPRLVRVTLTGSELAGFEVPAPAASVRLLLPSVGADLVVPTWNGNEFLLPDGRRPVIRTFTPRRLDLDLDRLELDLDLVVHGQGPASDWAGATRPGDAVAVSGPGRGYVLDPAVHDYVLAGDETAIPAVSQLLEVLGASVSVRVHLEVADPVAELDLPHHPGATVTWWPNASGAAPGDALRRAVAATELSPDTRIWVAGEAAAVHRIRRDLFEERGVPRSRATVRGYWKLGRGGDPDDT